MDRTSGHLRGARGVPLDRAARLISVLNEQLGDPVSRLAIGADGQGPFWSLDEHLEYLENELQSSAKKGPLELSFGVNASRRSKVFESVRMVFQGMDSYVSWKLGSQSLDAAMATVDAVIALWQVEEGGCSPGASTADRWDKRDLEIRKSDLDRHQQSLRWIKRDLFGIAPVQWFGSAFVEAFGGDSVFEGLPDGWAEKVAPGLWKVFGVEDPEDPEAFVVERWSDRERALIEALGPEFFFNVETGELASEFVEIPIATQYPVYLWDELAGELVVHEPDGSTRPANLSQSEGSASAVEAGRVGPPNLVPVVVDRMAELMGDVFVDDDQMYWIEQHLQVIPSLDDSWVEAFSVWLGEHVIAGILDAAWVEQSGRWVVSSARGVFDPELVVRATVGSEARGESRIMVRAACEAMGIPLP